MQELLLPIRERRKELEKDTDAIFEILKKGTEKAKAVAHKKLVEMKTNMGINYFN